MAAYDRDEQKIVVRVVYDGPPRAGKTTNLRELCRYFAVARRSDVYTPAEDHGRTLYFDWLQIDCGFVAGRALRCQLVSVPGQQEYALRRSQLLRAADAVVFVCESTLDEVRRARRGFEMLREYLARSGHSDVPIIVQANKQDLPGALSPEMVVAELGAGELAGAVAASASSGGGVRDTIVLAVRGVSKQLQRVVLARGIDGLGGEITTPETLYRDLLDADAAASDVIARIPEIPAAVAVSPAVVSIPVATNTSTATSTTTTTAVPVRNARSRDGVEPALPDADLPIGCVWPALTGRVALRELGVERAMHRSDLSVSLTGNADARRASIVYDAGAFRLRTGQRFRFEDVETGRAALRTHAQRRQHLGAMLASDSMLALQRAADDAWWLWSVSLRRPTLQAALVRASGRRDETALGDALSRFAEAATESAALAQWHELALDLHPSNYAVLENGALAYRDEFMEDVQADTDIATALLQRIEEYGHWPAATALYLEAMQRAMRRAVGNGLDVSAVIHAVSSAPVQSVPARRAREQLLSSLATTVNVEGETG